MSVSIQKIPAPLPPQNPGQVATTAARRRAVEIAAERWGMRASESAFSKFMTAATPFAKRLFFWASLIDIAPGDTPIRTPKPIPAIDKPPAALSVFQWIEEMAEQARVAAYILGLQNRMRLAQERGNQAEVAALQSHLDSIAILLLAAQNYGFPISSALQMVASAGGGNAATSSHGAIKKKDDNLYHADPLEWVEPSRRSVILLNAQYDSSKDGAYQWPPGNTPDSYLRDVESSLLGRMGTNPRLSTLDADAAARAMEEWNRNSLVYDHWAQEGGRSAVRRAKLPIRDEDIFRIYPDQDIVMELSGAGKTIAASQDSHQLTYIAITAHGTRENSEGSLSMNAIGLGRNEKGQYQVLGYDELLRFLDTIPGRKVVIVSACYSGNFVAAVMAHPRSFDYAVLADTSINQVSVGLNQMFFFGEIASYLHMEGPLSRVRMRTIDLIQHSPQTPTLFMGFDTIF